MRRAGVADVPLLVDLMEEFYAEAGYPLDRAAAAALFDALLADERLGQAFVIEHGGAAVGHLVLTICFSMEHGGMRGVVDDFFVRPAHRNAGHGRAALLELRGIAAGLGLRALTVEVGRENGPGQAVYRRAGFVPESDREVMQLVLANRA